MLYQIGDKCGQTTVPYPDLPVVIHTQSHQITFQETWSVSVIHKLPNYTREHILCQFETLYQLILQSHHTPPPFHPRCNGTYNLSSVFSILLLEEGHIVSPKLLLWFLSPLCRRDDVNHLKIGANVENELR